MARDVSDIVYDEQYLGRQGQPLTATGLYQSGVLYPRGILIFHQGGTWLSRRPTSTQPASGNPDWTLVMAGQFVAEVTLTADQINTSNSLPVPFLPNPPVGQVALLVMPVVALYIPGTTGFADAATFDIVFSDGNPLTNMSAACKPRIFDGDITQVVPGAFAQWQLYPTTATTPADIDIGTMALIGELAPQGYAIQGSTDTSGGDGSLFVSARYILVDLPVLLLEIINVHQTTKVFVVNGDASGVTGTLTVVGSTGNNGAYTVVSAAYLGTERAITAVNQGTKTFTVAGNHATQFPVDETLTVAGSTGNDGFYTIVSTTFTAGNTNIVVVEAIPDATADGTARGEISSTSIVVSQAIPDPTVDGWMKQPRP